MTGVILAQIVVVVTLILMIIGKTPMYITAVVGSTIAALQAGIPLYGVDPVTIKSLLIGGLNPVLIDMGGILLFICICSQPVFFMSSSETLPFKMPTTISEAVPNYHCGSRGRRRYRYDGRLHSGRYYRRCRRSRSY